MADVTNQLLADEERRLAAHRDVKSSMDGDVNSGLKLAAARVEPHEAADLSTVAHELRNKSVHEAVETAHELDRARSAARVSQVVDYCFYLIYGLIALKFVLAMVGARPVNGFVLLVGAVTWPLLKPFESIVGVPSAGAFQIQLPYLLALGVYILGHLATNAGLRLIAHRKVTV